jgi:hypothetical protein
MERLRIARLNRSKEPFFRHTQRCFRFTRSHHSGLPDFPLKVAAMTATVNGDTTTATLDGVHLRFAEPAGDGGGVQQ